MSNNPFVEISAERLEDCKFLEKLNAKLAETAQSIHDYRSKYRANAKTARAVLTVKIEVIAEPRECLPGDLTNSASWLVQTEFEVKKPKDHPGQSVPVCVTDDEGRPKLFVQRSGGFDGDPLQLRLATQDGRGINPETHEISPDHTLEITTTPCVAGP
jgi:hypothetical protein